MRLPTVGLLVGAKSSYRMASLLETAKWQPSLPGRMKKESPPEGEPPTSRLGIRWRVAATDPRLPEAAPAIVFPPSPFSREKADGGARRKWPDYSTLRVWASAPLRDEQQFDSVGMQNPRMPPKLNCHTKCLIYGRQPRGILSEPRRPLSLSPPPDWRAANHSTENAKVT